MANGYTQTVLKSLSIASIIKINWDVLCAAMIFQWSHRRRQWFRPISNNRRISKYMDVIVQNVWGNLLHQNDIKIALLCGKQTEPFVWYHAPLDCYETSLESFQRNKKKRSEFFPSHRATNATILQSFSNTIWREMWFLLTFSHFDIISVLDPISI